MAVAEKTSNSIDFGVYKSGLQVHENILNGARSISIVVSGDCALNLHFLILGDRVLASRHTLPSLKTQIPIPKILDLCTPCSLLGD